MAILAKLVNETVRAVFEAAVGANRETAGAGSFFAVAASLQTVIAGGLGTVMAVGAAAVADFLFAVIATTGVVVTHRVIADPALRARPFGQRDVRTAAVIGQQRLLDDLKEVPKSAIPESMFEGNSGVPFAESIFTDMRVGDVSSGDGRIRGFSDDLKQTRDEILTTEYHLKSSQLDLFKRDGLGDDTDRFLAEVEVDVFKLIRER